MEVGFGTALNAPYYPSGVTKVVAIEPSQVCMKIAEPRVAKASVAVAYGGLTATHSSKRTRILVFFMYLNWRATMLMRGARSRPDDVLRARGEAPAPREFSPGRTEDTIDYSNREITRLTRRLPRMCTDRRAEQRRVSGVGVQVGGATCGLKQRRHSRGSSRSWRENSHDKRPPCCRD
jgi:hypothetical protein